MERLTQRLRTGEVLMAPEYEEKYTAEEWIAVLQDRLAAYEDTERSPEEIAAMQHTLDEYHKAADPLLRAQADQRVVVLPCKVGDKLYRVFDGNISEHEVQNMKYFARQGRLGIDMTPFFPDAGKSIGKTVFLTREEAERALEGVTE